MHRGSKRRAALAGVLTVGWMLAGGAGSPGTAEQVHAIAIADMEIITIRPDGTGARRLTRNRYQEDHPTFSPSGREVVFARTRRPGYVQTPSDLWSLPLSEDQASRLVRANHARDGLTSPQFSPDGLSLAFLDTSSSSVQVVPSSGGSAATVWAVDIAQFEFAWTTDSTQILRAASDGGVFRDTPDTSELLTSIPGFIEDIAVAADGRIAFVRSGGLFVANPDGSSARRILRSGTRFSSISGLAWTPDSSRLAFDWLRCPARSLDIYSVRPDGSALRRLTGRGHQGPWETRPWSVSPAFAPDGSRIVFSRAAPWSEVDPCDP